jgi:anti-anti-sigma regulatory factor
VPGDPVRLDETPNVITITLNHSARAMRQVALTALQGPSRDVVIDLRDAAAMSYQELALLVGVRARQRARGRRLTLVCARDSATEQALSRAGMRKLFTTVPSLPEQHGLPDGDGTPSGVPGSGRVGR